jgi:hypothetical protein
MTKTTLNTNGIVSICWFNNSIVDVPFCGKMYYLDGKIEDKLKYHFGSIFDSSIISDNGVYAFIYKKTGTKGLLLKNGEILREINRSYYCAENYEYPACFLNRNDSETYLIHCPNAYNQIDFENVETGQMLTNIMGRKPSDFYHSRFEISPNNKYLLSKGWVWHPLSIMTLFDIEECFKNPLMLDNANNNPNVGTEVNTASFITETKILIGTSEDEELIDDELPDILPQKSIAIWNIETNEISKPTKLDFEFGNLFSIDENFAWDLYLFPKLINIHSGEIVFQDQELYSGKQNSSIIRNSDNEPKIAFDRITKKIAITNKEKIEIYSK